ncbi:unnamed protein product [Lupinus luteus]|uniref:LOB domain-containing protein n=1 Tax=Lupinus luteus TaxID=3873 RepID=A0AAV1YGD9_LUPLU
MRTIIYESNMRANDPVGGCVGFIHRIRSEIVRYEAELRVVLQHLKFFREQAQHQQLIRESVQYDPYLADNTMNVNDDVTPFRQSDIHIHEELKFLSQEYDIKHGIALENVNDWALQNSNSGT